MRVEFSMESAVSRGISPDSICSLILTLSSELGSDRTLPESASVAGEISSSGPVVISGRQPTGVLLNCLLGSHVVPAVVLLVPAVVLLVPAVVLAVVLLETVTGALVVDVESVVDEFNSGAVVVISLGVWSSSVDPLTLSLT